MTVDYIELILEEVRLQAVLPFLGFVNTRWVTEFLAIYIFEFVMGAFMAFLVPALDYITFYAERMMKRNRNIKKIDHPLDEGLFFKVIY